MTRFRFKVDFEDVASTCSERTIHCVFKIQQPFSRYDVTAFWISSIKVPCTSWPRRGITWRLVHCSHNQVAPLDLVWECNMARSLIIVVFYWFPICYVTQGTKYSPDSKSWTHVQTFSDSIVTGWEKQKPVYYSNLPGRQDDAMVSCPEFRVRVSCAGASAWH